MPLKLLDLTCDGSTLEVSTAPPTIWPGELYLTVTTQTKSRSMTGQIRLDVDAQRRLASLLNELDREVTAQDVQGDSST